MSLRISNVRMGLDEPEAALGDRVTRILGVGPSMVDGWRILRKSLDARDKDRLQFVYTVEVRVPQDEVQLARSRSARDVRIEQHEEPPFVMPRPGERPLAHRPVVIG